MSYSIAFSLTFMERNSNLHSEGGTVDAGQMSGSRMVGLFNIYYENLLSKPEHKEADTRWHKYSGPEESGLPTSLPMPVEDSETYANNNAYQG